jgi:hypothetical protein
MHTTQRLQEKNYAYNLSLERKIYAQVILHLVVCTSCTHKFCANQTYTSKLCDKIYRSKLCIKIVLCVLLPASRVDCRRKKDSNTKCKTLAPYHLLYVPCLPLCCCGLQNFLVCLPWWWEVTKESASYLPQNDNIFGT